MSETSVIAPPNTCSSSPSTSHNVPETNGHMKLKSPFSRISSAKSGAIHKATKSDPVTATPQAAVTAATVERSSWVGEPGSFESPGETLASLELDIEGEFKSDSASDSEVVTTQFRAPKMKNKRNKLRQLVSTDPSSQPDYLYDFDVTADILDARNTTMHKPPQLDVIVGPPGVTEVSSSPNTILPGNALQLHLAADDAEETSNGYTTTPNTPFSSSSSPVEHHFTQHRSTDEDPLVIPSEVMSLNDQSAEVTPRPPARVHFRSRVRIASGLHSSRNHQHRHEGAIPRSRSRPSVDDLTSTTNSGSPSSSISAPLRYHPDENNVLGPLGKRLSSLAQSRKKRLGQVKYQGEVDERTPFLRAGGSEDGSVPDYSRRRRRRVYSTDGSGGEEDEDVRSGLKREQDVLFGKWPWRLCNRHWWWYQCEPIFFCCGDDLDDE